MKKGPCKLASVRLTETSDTKFNILIIFKNTTQRNKQFNKIQKEIQI